MVYKGEISIQMVLAEIRAGDGTPFFLQFARATGEKRGQIKTVAKAIYGKPASSHIYNPNPSPGPTMRNKALHIEHGTLPIYDYETKQYLTPLIGTFMTYNGYKIRH